MSLIPLHRKESDVWQVGDYPIGMVRDPEGWVPLITTSGREAGGVRKVREWLEQANLYDKSFKTRRELHQALSDAIEIHPGLVSVERHPCKRVAGGYLLTGGIMATRAPGGRWDLHSPATGKSYPRKDTLRLAASSAAMWHQIGQERIDENSRRKPLSSFQMPIAA